MTSFLLTGSSGVVGVNLSLQLLSRGVTVIPIMRQDKTGQYTLVAKDFTDSDLVIHAGIPSHPRTPKKRHEYIRNTIELFNYAREFGINLVFISSHSARFNNPSQYSRDKLFLEKMALDYGFSVVRLGIFSSSVSNKRSLILKFLEIMRFSKLEQISENLPRSCSEELLVCLDLASEDNGTRWNCYSFLKKDFNLEKFRDESDASCRIMPENIGPRRRERFGMKFVNIVNAVTFSISDPIFNLISDLKYYGK